MSSTRTWPQRGKSSLIAILALAWISSAQSQEADWVRQGAPAGGWAAESGGTQGGGEAAAGRIYTVSTAGELRDAAWGFRARIVQIRGTIDMSEGRPFSGTSDQKQRGTINVGPNTTIVGLGADARVINGNFMIDGTSQVILRNLTIENPCDAGPVFDPGDGPGGAWNSEFDGVTIQASHHIWIDHVTFTDGSKTNDTLPFVNGHVMECHDGALDVKRSANYITVSNSVFTLHDKNNLIGHSDNATVDRAYLKVTFHDNLFRDVGQRAPRVRHGQVHVYNNAFIGSKTHKAYPYLYSIGIGVGSRIISEHNNFAIEGVDACSGVLKNWGGKTFLDTGSMLNGKPLDAAKCGYDSDVGWMPPYAYSLRPVDQVESWVLAHAGVGKLKVPNGP